MKHFTLRIILLAVVTLSVIGEASAVPREYPPSGSTRPTADDSLKIWKSWAANTETAKIMSVLEDRIEDPEILAKTRDKLFTLGDEEIRLVSSLCDRIPTGERTARAEIVFSLVTVLIVLS
jgi:hypothetical protein